MKRERGMTPHHQGAVANYERLILAAEMLTDAERRALAQWEREHVWGGGSATSEWPGWRDVLSRLQH